MNTVVIPPNQCPNCGRPIPAGALAGLCPACLLAEGAETRSGGQPGADRFQPPSLEQVAKLFPQLEISKLLGAGGMGAVYQARQPALDRVVALKVLPGGGGSGSTERFNREARALARLSHPNIVAVHEFGQVEGLHYFIMEFVDGANLRQLEKTSRLSPREALQIIPQICDALQYAHDEGVVHRDIKPENVLVDRKGRVKIADFGLAKIVNANPAAARLTVEGQVMGTPHYMAPEQVERPLTVDHRADIYALGVVFYEMLTGDLPLGKFAPPSRKVQVDVRLDDIVLRALENDPERRYQQASEVKSEIQTVASGPPPKAADSQNTEMAPVHAAGFPLVEDQGGQRRIVWKEVLRAWAIIFGLLTLAFAFFSAVTGRSLMGWLGIVGWQSLVYRAVIGGVLVVFALKHALRPQTLPQLRHAPGRAPAVWWQSRALRLCIFVAMGALASTWMVFQDNWLALRMAGWWGRSEFGRVQVAQLDTSTGTLSATLKNGATIELLALALRDAEANQWWRPDGTPLPDAAFDIQGPADMLGSDRMRTKFAFKVSGTPWVMETAAHEFEPSAGISAGGQVWLDGDKVTGGWPIVAAWTHVTNRATLRFGLRLDDWRNIATFDLTDPPRLETRTVAGDPKWITGFNHHTDDGTNTLLTVVLNAESKLWRTRVVAVDTEGREHAYNRANATPAGNSATWTCTFANLTVDRIREFQVQVQTVHWIEFRNVPLQPSGSLATPSRPLDISTQFGLAQQITFDELLDLDTGRTGSFPVNPHGENSVNPLAGIGENIAWMQEQGFDLEAGPGRVGMLGVKLVYLSAADWESLAPADLRHRPREQGTMPTELRPPDAALPVTAGFRTREGAEGLFQIVRFADERSATTLKLKHAQVAQVESHAVNRRAVDARLEELGNPLDLSSPEGAVASFGMSLLESPDTAATVAATTIGLPRLKPGSITFAPIPAHASALPSRRIVSVATYRQHLACVTVTGPPGETATYVSLIAGWRDGQWHLIPAMSLGLTPSVGAAENRFANAASALWSRFQASPTTVPVSAELGAGIAAEQTADLLRATVAMLANAGASAPKKSR